MNILNYTTTQNQLNNGTIGSTRPRVNLEHIRNILIPIPSLNEQRKIAAILSSVDEAIEKTANVIVKLKTAREGLLRNLFTYGLDKQGRLRDLVAHPDMFRNSSFGPIPKEWTKGSFGKVKNQTRSCIKTGPFGSSLKGEHWVDRGVPVITIGSLGEGEFIKSQLLFITEKKARSLSSYAVEPGDLVFSRVADVGRSVVVGESEKGWIMSSNLMRISLDKSLILPVFAYLNLVYNINSKKQIRQCVNSSGRDVATTQILKSLKFYWPTYGEQVRISNIIESINLRIRAEDEHLHMLKQLKRGLMHDLLTGRVRVKVDRHA